jgi:hypothetical protein
MYTGIHKAHPVTCIGVRAVRRFSVMWPGPFPSDEQPFHKGGTSRWLSAGNRWLMSFHENAAFGTGDLHRFSHEVE